MPVFFDAAGEEYDVPDGSTDGALAMGLRPDRPVPANTLPIGAPELPQVQAAAPAQVAPVAPVAAEPVPEATVAMTGPDGAEYDVPESSLAEAQSKLGFMPSEVARQEQLQADYGDAASQARTAGEGFLSGATFGISDAVQSLGSGIGSSLGNAVSNAMPRSLGGMGDQPNRTLVESDGFDNVATAEASQAIDARREANPWTSGISQGVGMVAPVLLSGGLAGAEMAAAAAVTPAAKAAQLGLRVQTALASKLPATALGRIGAMAGAGATEGALQSAARVVVDDIRQGDYEITAERMLSGLGDLALQTGTGAALGFGAGAVVGGAIEGVSATVNGAGRLVRAMTGRGGKATQQAATELDAQAAASAQAASQSTGEASGVAGVTSDVGAEIDNTLSSQVSGDASVDLDLTLEPIMAQEARGPLRSMDIPSDDRGVASGLFAKAKAAEGAFEDGQQGAVRSISSDFDSLLKSVNSIDELAGIAAKRVASEAYNIEGARIGMQEFSPAINSLRDRVASLLSSDVRKQAVKSGGGYTAISRVLDTADAAEKEIAGLLANGRVGDAYMVADDLKRTVGMAAKSKNGLVSDAFVGEYGKIQRFMEDETLFGELATRQKRANPAWTERIRRQNDGDMGQFFKRGAEAAENPFEVLDKTNRQSLGSLLKSLGDEEVAGTEEALRRYLRATAIDAKTRASAWGTPALEARAAEIAAAVDRIESGMNAVALLRRDSRSWQKIKDSVESVPFAGFALKGAARLTQTVAGSAQSGVLAKVGARASAGAGVASKSGANASATSNGSAALSHLATAAEKQESLIQRAANGMVNAIGKAGAVKSSSPLSATTMRGIIAQAREIANDNASPAAQELQRHVSDLSEESPELAQALDMKRRQQAEFIAVKAGPEVDDGDPFNSRPPPMDSQRARAMQRYVEAAQRPELALQRLGQGRGTKEDVETLKALYPRLYARYVGAVQDRLGKIKKAPTTLQRQRIQYATGEVMAREQQPANLKFFQSIAVSQQQKPDENANSAPIKKGGGGKGPDAHYASRTDELISRGAYDRD